MSEETAKLIDLAHEGGDIGVELGARALHGGALVYLGRLAAATSALEEALSRYVPDRDIGLATRHGQDPGVMANLFLSWIAALRGDARKAAKHVEAGLALADSTQNPYTRSLALSFASTTNQLLGDWTEADRHSAEALKLAVPRHFVFWVAMGRVLHGISGAMLGQTEAGIRESLAGLKGWESGGARLALGIYHGLLAGVHLAQGHRDEGLETVDAGVLIAEETLERWWLAELWRVRGELLRLAPPDLAGAEGAFQTRP